MDFPLSTREIDKILNDEIDLMDWRDSRNSYFDVLYDYYFDEMPYGVQKARSGDPYEWIIDRLYQDFTSH